MKKEYVIVSSIKNEAANIEKTIKAVTSQIVQPLLWVIIDDGSTDSTKEIVNLYLKKNPWIKLFSKPQANGYKLGGRIVENFYLGLRLVNCKYEYLVKLDGDLSFGADYFLILLKRFEENPKLGIASGQTFIPMGDQLLWEDMPDDHVRGAIKMYRRICFEQIDGFVASLGWDTLDEIRAQMRGWEIKSYRDLQVIHYRMMASREGIFQGNMRMGKIAYIVGYHPAYFFLRAIYRCFTPPIILGGISLLWGYVSSFLKKEKVVASKDEVSFFRRRQMDKIFKDAFCLQYIKRILKGTKKI